MAGADGKDNSRKEEKIPTKKKYWYKHKSKSTPITFLIVMHNVRVIVLLVVVGGGGFVAWALLLFPSLQDLFCTQRCPVQISTYWNYPILFCGDKRNPHSQPQKAQPMKFFSKLRLCCTYHTVLP